MIRELRFRPPFAAATLMAAASILSPLAPAEAQIAACGPSNPTNWCVHQDSAGVTDAAEPDERFGAALTFGDFNGDGFDDLAVGVPEEEDVGAVHVFFGSSSGLILSGQLFFSQNNVGGADGGAETGDEFGFALAAGDFDGDGFDDLAVGSPGEDLPELDSDDCTLFECEDAGGVHILSGSAGGLVLGASSFFQEDDITSQGNLSEGARMGASLTAGDQSFVPDGFDDLIIGQPSRGISQFLELGQALVGFGGAAGFNTANQGFRFSSSPEDCGNQGIRFGAASTIAQLDDDAQLEVLTAAPGCEVSSVPGAGAIFLYLTTASSVPDALFVQSDFSTAGNGVDDLFGTALVAGDFDDNGFDDLAAGAPGKDHGSGNPNDSGRVYVAYSGADGPDPAMGPDLIGEDEWAGQTPAAGENFGAALAAGDATGDGFDDLLAGAPGEGAQGGFLFLKPGSTTGLTTTGNVVISQGFLGGLSESGDRFGSVLALGDVNGDGIPEVAVGVPNKDVGANGDAGMVYVTHFFDSAWIFSDGFESGTTAAWSVVMP